MSLLPSLNDLADTIRSLESKTHAVRIFDAQNKDYMDLSPTEAYNFLSNTTAQTVNAVTDKEVTIINDKQYAYRISILRKEFVPVSLRTI